MLFIFLKLHITTLKLWKIKITYWSHIKMNKFAYKYRLY